MSQKLFLAFAIVLCIQQVKNPQKMRLKRKTCSSWQAVCRPQQGEAGQPEPESEPEPGKGAGNLLQQVATQWWISKFFFPLYLILSIPAYHVIPRLVGSWTSIRARSPACWDFLMERLAENPRRCSPPFLRSVWKILLVDIYTIYPCCQDEEMYFMDIPYFSVVCTYTKCLIS